jgi:large conductance mechanosensitive channel
MWKEFKDFAMKGNLIDIAVGFVMGGAFGKVVSSFTDGLVAPLVGLITGGVDLSRMKIVMKAAELDAAGAVVKPELALNYGTFLTAFLDLLILSFVMFLIVKAINAAKKKQAEAPAPPSVSETLLAEIRDLLKKK